MTLVFSLLLINKHWFLQFYGNTFYQIDNINQLL